MRGRSAEERLWPAVLGGWLLAITVLASIWGSRVPAMLFPDPDDAMRLLQVRDWLAGQSWWDVSQYRLNGGDFPMHWSRLVDLPIAAALLLFDPLLGSALADRVAGTVVPAGTLLVIMRLSATLTRKLAGAEAARLTVLIVPLAAPILVQVQPMRFDHHAWQIVWALAAVSPLIGRADAIGGALCGLALATLITISLEGFPFAVAVASVAALAWVLDPARRAFLLGLVQALAGATGLLHLATRGPNIMLPVCDAVSPVWLAVLATAAAGASLATFAPTFDRRSRLAALVPAGAACVAVLLFVQPECANGPFASLPPLVREQWYDNVLEGLPVWRQSFAAAAIALGLPLFGVVGSWRAWRMAPEERRPAWLLMSAVTAAAMIVSIVVIRASGVANAVATPGAAVLLLSLFRRARAVRGMLPRVAATACALMLASPGIAVAALTTFDDETSDADARATCAEAADIRAMGALPPAIVLAPLDVTPDLIATTAHRGVAAGYHRNPHAIQRVFEAFTAPPERARVLVEEMGAAYVAACLGADETELYKDVAPDGLWARLERGDAPDWLRPVPLPGSPVRAWRVDRR